MTQLNPLKAALLILLTFSLINLKISHAKVLKSSNNSGLCVGAYYFNGWTGLTNHITPSLRSGFAERKPGWGWGNSTQSTMQNEIDLAANSGLSFFSFCWYYVNSDSTRFRNHPLNNAVTLFLNSPNHNRLKFNLLVANHTGDIIGPKDWNTVSKVWVSYFLNPSYLTADNKPLITFFSVKTLVQQFGSTTAVKQALNQLRAMAQQKGIAAIEIAACVNESQTDIDQAQECGFDVLTAYNNHYAGFDRNNDKVLPMSSLTNGMVKIWNRFDNINMPYIPAITANWDPRPWAQMDPSYASSPRYTGFSSQSIRDQIQKAQTWVNAHSSIVPGKIVIIYAWNEYGEGAWLTPNDSQDYLTGIKQALLGE